jgi:hypothetical protein
MRAKPTNRIGGRSHSIEYRSKESSVGKDDLFATGVADPMA